MKFKNQSNISINIKLSGNFQTIKPGDVVELSEHLANNLGLVKVESKKVKVKKKVVSKSKKSKKE